MVWTYALAWLPLVPLAIANGVLREKGYSKRMSELRAHQVSTAVAIALFGVYIWCVVALWPPQSSAQAGAVGVMWFALTIAFEVLFGHYVAGAPWGRLFHDYNMLAGRVWVAIPIWIAVAPYVFHRLRT